MLDNRVPTIDYTILKSFADVHLRRVTHTWLVLGGRMITDKLVKKNQRTAALP